jgi:hypothetical protein
MELQAHYIRLYIFLQALPKALQRTRIMNATEDSVPTNQAIAYNIPETLPRVYFADSTIFWTESALIPINQDVHS